MLPHHPLRNLNSLSRGLYSRLAQVNIVLSAKTSRNGSKKSKWSIIKKLLYVGTPLAFILNFPDALCMASDDKNKSQNKSNNSSTPAGENDPADPIEKLIEKFAPVIIPIGMSGAFGFAAGIAFRRVSVNAAYLVGVAFSGLQLLQYYGIIQINYKEVQEKAKNILDADGDNEITSKDFIIIYRKIKQFLSEGLPNVGGFASGFALGIYYG